VIVPPIAATEGPKPGVTSSRVPIRVRFAETDLMGIVHHASYLIYVEEARVEYLLRRGANYADWAARGVHFPVIDARVRYRAAAAFPERLEVECWVGELTRVSVRFDYRIFRGDTVLAEAYTTLACVDHQRLPKRVPPEVAAVLMRAENLT
jgi:acyl-CoA thioester hydrolase